MTDARWAEARAKAVAFTRRNLLVETYKMRPDWMRTMIDYYGPLDWRLAQTHGLYWSTWGVHHIQGISPAELHKLDKAPAANQQAVPILNTHRNVLNSLKEICFYGRIVLTYNPDDPGLPGLMEKPDWRFIEVCDKEHIRTKIFLLGENDNKTYDAFIDGHVNFLADVVCQLFLGGHQEEAQKYFDYIRKTYKKGQPEWELNLHDWVWRFIGLEGQITRTSAMSLTMALINNAFEQGLMGYRDEMALAMQTAEQIRNDYDSKATTRNKIPDMPSLQATVAAEMISYLPSTVAMELYEMLPVNLQRAVYDSISTYMPQRCEREHVDFAKAFPEPEGMAGFRQRRDEAIKQSDKPHQRMADDKEN